MAETLFGLHRREWIASAPFLEEVVPGSQKVTPKPPKVDDVEPKVAPKLPKGAPDGEVRAAKMVNFRRTFESSCTDRRTNRKSAQT